MCPDGVGGRDDTAVKTPPVGLPCMAVENRADTGLDGDDDSLRRAAATAAGETDGVASACGALPTTPPPALPVAGDGGIRLPLRSPPAWAMAAGEWRPLLGPGPLVRRVLAPSHALANHVGRSASILFGRRLDLVSLLHSLNYSSHVISHCFSSIGFNWLFPVFQRFPLPPA